MLKKVAAGVTIAGTLLIGTSAPALAVDYVDSAPACTVERPTIAVGEQTEIACRWAEDVSGLEVTFDVAGAGVVGDTLSSIAMQTRTGSSSVVRTVTGDTASTLFRGPSARTYTIEISWMGANGVSTTDVDVVVVDAAAKDDVLARTGGGEWTPMYLWAGIATVAVGTFVWVLTSLRRRKGSTL